MEDSLTEHVFPRYFIIETVRRCNSRCPFCVTGTGNGGEGGTMPTALFDKLLSEMRPRAAEIEQVSLYGNGEPLLDGEIAERIRQTKDLGVKVFLTSNMSLVDEAAAKAVLAAGIDTMRFSISSVIREKYEQLRPGLDFDTVMHNAENYFMLRDRLRPESRIHVSMEEHGILTREDITAWRKHWAKFLKPGDFLKSSPVFPFSRYDGTPGHDREYIKPCSAMLQTMHIAYNGNVNLCTRDIAGDSSPFLMGNVTRSGIVDVWLSPWHRECRELHRAGRRNEIPICQGCFAWDGEHKSAFEA